MARPWFAFYPGDYLGDTLALTTQQHGAYLLLLMAYWQRQGPLPDDDKQLAAICRLPLKSFRREKNCLAIFFTLVDGMWRSKRMDAEIAKTAEIIASKANAGRKSAEKRAATPEQKGQQNTNGRSTDVGTDEPTEGATERQQTGQQKGNQPPSPSPLGLDDKKNQGEEDDGLELPPFMNAALRPQFQRVKGGAKRFAGLGERERGHKQPAKADQDMVRHLTGHRGMDNGEAWATVMAARDPADEKHIEAARLCENESREHRLGWFHQEAAE